MPTGGTWRDIPVVFTYPLTTIFTAPDWCSNSFYTYHPLSTTIPGPSYFLRAQGTDGSRAFDDKYKDCYPPTFAHINEVFTATVPSRRAAIYSPGVCPAGWYSNVIPGSSSHGVTSYACCPLGFQWQNYQACKSAPSTPTVVALNPSKNITIQPPYVLEDWPINIAWASSDLNKFTPASAPLVLSKVTGAASQSSSGLSTAAIAGIGAGVGVVCLALITLLVFLLLFRKRHRQRQLAEAERQRASQKFQEYQYPKSPPGYESPRSASAMEFPKVASGLASPASELSSENRVSELDSTRRTSELESAKRTSELEVPRVGSAPASPELDSTQVYEAHGTPLHTISYDELSQLGLAPASGMRGTRDRGGIRHGASNASTMYSANDTSEGSEEGRPMPGTLQGRWSEWSDHNPSYGYGHAL